MQERQIISKYKNISETGDVRLLQPKIDINPVGMSFLNCPNCSHQLYFPCECEPKNYACENCKWKYYNHKHIENINPKSQEEGPGNLHPFKFPN